jgi:hypothetical protein
LLADAPTGLDHILVNGAPIRRDGHFVGGEIEQRPGRILTTVG